MDAEKIIKEIDRNIVQLEKDYILAHNSYRFIYEFSLYQLSKILKEIKLEDYPHMLKALKQGIAEVMEEVNLKKNRQDEFDSRIVKQIVTHVLDWYKCEKEKEEDEKC